MTDMAEIRIYAKPASLYRYRPLGEDAEREIKAIAEGFIYCPAYSQLNDPMEGKHRLSSRFVENPNSAKSKARVDAAFAQMGVASLSEVFDHEPMWAHYADEFRGMCIEYSLNRLLKGLDPSLAITRMMYSEKEPVLLDDKSNASDRARLCLSSKTVRWANEREWRIFRDHTGKAEYGDLNAVTRVYLGSRVTAADEAAVCDAARVARIAVSKMDVDAYSLNFKLLQSPIRKKPTKAG